MKKVKKLDKSLGLFDFIQNRWNDVSFFRESFAILYCSVEKNNYTDIAITINKVNYDEYNTCYAHSLCKWKLHTKARHELMR